VDLSGRDLKNAILSSAPIFRRYLLLRCLERLCIVCNSAVQVQREGRSCHFSVFLYFRDTSRQNHLSSPSFLISKTPTRSYQNAWNVWQVS